MTVGFLVAWQCFYFRFGLLRIKSLSRGLWLWCGSPSHDQFAHRPLTSCFRRPTRAHILQKCESDLAQIVASLTLNNNILHRL